MKILFLHRFRNFAGAERQLVDLAKGLSQRDHEIVLVTFYASDRVASALAGSSVRVVSLNKRGRWDLPGFCWRLVRTLSRERPQIAHGYLGFANAALILTRPFHSAKVIWGVRSSDIDISRYSRLARLDARTEAALSRFPSLTISNSTSGQTAAIARGFPPDRLVVIPNGIDLHRFRRDEAGRQRLRAEWGVFDETPLIGRVGRIDPQKDFETFLRAAKQLTAVRPDLRFVLVTTDPHGVLSSLRQFADDLGFGPEIIWSDAREDMAAVYSAFDLNVSSSAYGEGVPNVLIEAMACGTPCVSTDAGDSAATLAGLGTVVPHANPDALTLAIADALSQPVDRDLLRAAMAERFAMDRLVTRSESAFAAVLSGADPVRVLEQTA